MQDRLGELGLAQPTSTSAPADVAIEMNTGANPPYMQHFFDNVAAIKAQLAAIKENVSLIEQLHGECLTAISTEQGRAATERLDELRRTTQGAATDTTNQLKRMTASNKEFSARNPGASEARIRDNMQKTLSRKFVDLMAEYQEIQTRYKGKYRERVVRQYKIVKPDVTSEEIEDALESGGAQPEIFTQQILQGPGHASARKALADCQEKHRDILKLESSIKELHELFLEMSVLVESQGELLDQIEYTVGQSVNFTGRAVDELRSASKYQKKVRAKMCCIAITLIIILVIILASVFGSRGNDS